MLRYYEILRFENLFYKLVYKWRRFYQFFVDRRNPLVSIVRLDGSRNEARPLRNKKLEERSGRWCGWEEGAIDGAGVDPRSPRDDECYTYCCIVFTKRAGNSRKRGKVRGGRGKFNDNN